MLQYFDFTIISCKNFNLKAIILLGNDILTEGLYVFEDGTEMEWVSNLVNGMHGASMDGVILNTENNAYAGRWIDAPITNSYRYICEKN